MFTVIVVAVLVTYYPTATTATTTAATTYHYTQTLATAQKSRIIRCEDDCVQVGVL